MVCHSEYITLITLKHYVTILTLYADTIDNIYQTPHVHIAGNYLSVCMYFLHINNSITSVVNISHKVHNIKLNESPYNTFIHDKLCTIYIK